MKIAVRPANSGDVHWLLGELKKFSDFYGSKRPLFEDPAQVEKTVLWLMNEHVFLMADSVTEVGTGFQQAVRVGFIAGVVTPHFLNPNIRLLAELFWWVKEDYRGTSAGYRLLNAYTEWGKNHADWMTMALEAHSPVKTDALTKRGWKLQERSFLMEVS